MIISIRIIRRWIINKKIKVRRRIKIREWGGKESRIGKGISVVGIEIAMKVVIW